MTSPILQPVYLVVPSSGPGDVAAGFVDYFASRPATAESILLGILEYSTFLNELSPLGASMENVARAGLSGFSGVSYALLSEQLAILLEYDMYRLTEDGMRASRPVVVVVVNEPASTDDEWTPIAPLMCAGDDGTEGTEGISPIVATVCTRPELIETAAAIADPSALAQMSVGCDRMGAFAAETALHAQKAWGIREVSKPASPLRKVSGHDR